VELEEDLASKLVVGSVISKEETADIDVGTVINHRDSHSRDRLGVSSSGDTSGNEGDLAVGGDDVG
jgi:hypothetical protein